MVRLLATDLEKQCEASAVALACCSKRLADIALDSVWEEVRGLRRLMRCLPPDTWEIRRREFVRTSRYGLLAWWLNGQQVFIRCPSNKEWIRFSSYARRIRTFCLHSEPLVSPGVSWTAFNILSMQVPTLGRYPLPNVRSVHLSYLDTWDFAYFLRLFLNPGLTEVRIGFPDDSDYLYRSPIVSLIPTGDLTHLSLNHSEWTHKPPGVLHDILDGASGTLRSVSLHGCVSVATINKLLQLPHLRYLNAGLPEARISPPVVVFPSLEKLDVWYREVGSWVHTLQNIPLQELVVNVVGHPPAYLQMLGSSLLNANVERTLTSLKCRSWATVPLTEAGIRPLLSFGRLKMLDLSVSCDESECGIRLNDSIISELATALPQLTSLGLGDTPCKASTSDVTVASLVALSTNCVDLDYLRLHFDANDIVTRGTYAYSQARKFTCKLRTLSVGSQPLPSDHDDILLVTSAILHIFPHVETISSAEGDWSRVREGVEMLREVSRVGPLAEN